MAVPTQDQMMAQLRLIIPALGTIVTAVGVSSVQVNYWVGIGMAAVGPISYIATVVWSLYANSRKSIMLSASQPVSPGVAPPRIILPPEEAALAEKLPDNVTSTPVKIK